MTDIQVECVYSDGTGNMLPLHSEHFNAVLYKKAIQHFKKA